MFTIKFYSNDGYRSIIKEAESFTILRGGDGGAEITLHQKNSLDDSRIDIGDDGPNGPTRLSDWPPVYGKAIIENSAGKTTEIICVRTYTGPPQPSIGNMSVPTGPA